MKPTAAVTIGPARLVAVGTPEQPPLCGLLVDAGKLEMADVDRSLRLQREQEDWERIGSILVKLGLVSERDVAESLAGQLGLDLVDKVDYPDEVPGNGKIAQRFLKKNKTLIFDEDDDDLTIVMADPLDEYVV
ncbi:MAG: hypothetical protein KAJ57_06195, partial [Woeseiaceae bacterium]|nr:hypothetical protein [Woeseiaceae bacterium]